jgi:calcineurin-like phosphoesterase family protein
MKESDRVTAKRIHTSSNLVILSPDVEVLYSRVPSSVAIAGGRIRREISLMARYQLHLHHGHKHAEVPTKTKLLPAQYPESFAR